MSDHASVDAAAASCVELSKQRIDILVNNAGMFAANDSVEKANVDDWEKTMMVNLVNPMRLTRLLFAGAMQHSDKDGHEGCSIINISSISGTMSMSGSASYCASKHGMNGFNGCAFDDLRARGIKVCALCPGFVNTPMAGSQVDSSIDLSKMIQPDDLAEMVLYCICSPKSLCPVEILVRPQYPVRK